MVNVCSVHEIPWERQFPNGETVWGNYKFIFNANSSFDYIIVFDDLRHVIQLPVGFSNTIHVATEPPTICKYDIKYLKQFKFIISLQKGVNHDGAIYTQPGLNWHLGCSDKDKNKFLNFEELLSLDIENKNKLISIISSNKKMTKDHAKRIEFSKKIKNYFSEKIDFYGRGFNDFDDKINTLLDYRFQIVIENSSFDNYFSEKLTDCILAGTYPIYYGCKNLIDYFPINSFVQIDIDDFDKSIEIIENAIRNNYDVKYRDNLLEARRKILFEHNFFPMISKILDKNLHSDNSSNNSIILKDNKLIPLRSDEFKKIKFSKFKYLIYLLGVKFRVFSFFIRIYVYFSDKVKNFFRI